MIKNILSRLFDPYHGLTKGQITALNLLNVDHQNFVDKINASYAQAASSGGAIGNDLEFMKREHMEAFSYSMNFIKNNPHLVEEDGRIMPQININGRMQYVSWDEFERRIGNRQEQLQ